jgi:hypothetical protein
MQHNSTNWMSPQLFVWRRTSAIRDQYGLHAGEACLARLTLGGLLLPTAHVEAGGHELDLAVGGVGNRQVVIADAQTEQVVAGFERRWTGRSGVLRLQDGGQLEWRWTGRWRPGYVFTDRFSNPVVRFHLDGRVEGYGIGGEWRRSVSSRRDLLLVLSLGWLLLLVNGEARPPRAVAPPERSRPLAAPSAAEVVVDRGEKIVQIDAGGRGGKAAEPGGGQDHAVAQ